MLQIDVKTQFLEGRSPAEFSSNPAPTHIPCSFQISLNDVISWISENESDIRPSMVTHIRNLCSTFDPSKVHTHSSEQNTHTPWPHTRSSGQPFMLRRPGSSWGFGALLKGTSVMVLKVERALYIHSPHLQFLPARDLNSQPFDYESDSLTIRPRLLMRVASKLCRAVALQELSLTPLVYTVRHFKGFYSNLLATLLL